MKDAVTPQPLEASAQPSLWRSIRDSFSPYGDYPALGNYYLVFWRFALAQLGWSVIPLTIGLFVVPHHLRIWVAIIFSCKVLLGCVLSALVVSKYYPVQVGSEGIRARDLGGMAVRLQWDQIAAVNATICLPQAPYARVSTARKKHAVYLPLFLKEMDGFVNQVVEHAPPGNPLRQFLETRRRLEQRQLAEARHR